MLRRIHFHRCNCLTLSYFSVSLCFFPIFFLNRQKTLKAWHKSCWGRSLQSVLLKAFKYSVFLYSPILCRMRLGLCNICSDVWWESPSTDTKQDISVWIQTVGQTSASAGFWDSLYSLWKEKKIKKKKRQIRLWYVSQDLFWTNCPASPVKTSQLAWRRTLVQANLHSF